MNRLLSKLHCLQHDYSTCLVRKARYGANSDSTFFGLERLANEFNFDHIIHSVFEGNSAYLTEQAL